MLTMKIMTGKQEVYSRLAPLLEGKPLPAFLYDASGYCGVLIGAFEGEQAAGMGYGVVETGGDMFYLHEFFLLPEYRTVNNLIGMIRQLLSAAEQRYGVGKAVWSYELPPDKPDSYEKLLKKLTAYIIEEKFVLRKFGVRTEGFHYLRQFHWYCPELLEKKGFYAKPWVQCDPEVIAGIRRQEATMDMEKAYVSPFSDDKWEYDSTTSFALVRREKGAICGWIICERLSPSAVKLRRFYIDGRTRPYRLGPAFSTYVLDVIAAAYDTMWFEVVKGNAQMERVADRQFGPIMEYSACICTVTIKKIKEETEYEVDTGKNRKDVSGDSKEGNGGRGV